VLEYLNTVSERLPAGIVPRLGPDASGLGWVLMYALRSRQRDLAELRSLQDWYLRYELGSIEGVAEVASLGGFVRSYRITVDPLKLRAYGLTLADVQSAVRNSSREVGGEVIEMSEMEYMVRGVGYISSEDDLRRIPVGMRPAGPADFPTADAPMGREGMAPGAPDVPDMARPGALSPPVLQVPIFLSEIAHITREPMPRRGIAELDGEGEVVGGIVVARYGANALEVIRAVKRKLEEVRRSLPADVEVVITYDRSKLIEAAIATLREKLLEESLVVLLVCFVFLFHFGSGVVILIALPVSILLAFVVMKLQASPPTSCRSGELPLPSGQWWMPGLSWWRMSTGAWRTVRVQPNAWSSSAKPRTR
jgi:Cu(I)/Ag(I) efflux system membrane protein CusA/SilA